MQKVDLKKELKNLYNPSLKEVSLVDVPEMNFVMLDGSGDPNTAREYQDAIEALYAISYALKFAIKKNQGVDYGVMPLEGLWWADDMSLFTASKDNWKWTAMIMQPEYVTRTLFESALEQVKKKKSLPALSRARLQSFQEGQSAQIMYTGPFSDEGPTIARIHEFIKARGDTFDGLKQKHHEIYLSDPRKTAPDKLKTIIRQPVQPR
ncbi:MAG: GyrI-like domain-containing protein [Chloroflexota bacterium]